MGEERDENRRTDDYVSISGLPPAAEAEMFRSIAISSRSAVIVADPAGIIVWANNATYRIFDWPDGQLVGEPLTVLTTEETHDEASRLRSRVLGGEEVGGFLTTGVRHDGRTFPLALTPAVRHTPDGKVLGISVIGRDVTYERRVQDDLTEALARSHARFDQVAQPQALLDLEGRFVAVNDAVCSLLGMPRSRLLGRDSRELVYAVDLASAAARLDELAAGRVDSISYEAVATRGDGAEVPLLLDVSFVRGPDGRPRELVVFARDLSDLQEAERRLREQDAFFRALYRRAADPAFVSDDRGHLVYVSPAFTRVFGFRAADLVGRDGFELVHPDDLAKAEQMLVTVLRRPDETHRLRLRARDVSGAWRWFDARATNCLADPAIRGIVVNMREMTAEVEADERLRRSEARYRAIVETAQEGILALDPDGAVMFANDKMAEILGVSLEQLYSLGLVAFLDPDEAARTHQRLRTRVVVGPEHYETEVTRADGSRRTLSVAASPLVDDGGTPLGSLGMVADVTSAREAEAELRHQALHDALTGLPNRALLVDRLEMAAARQVRDDGRGLAVLFLDLDHFKQVNDSRGHEAGDRVLREVAGRIEQAVRETDTVARLGGDEFAIVCEDSSREDADSVAARIQELLAQPIQLDDERVYMGASIGIAVSPPYSVSDLLRLADAAMYTSKLQGRSLVTTFEGTEPRASQRRLAIAAGLREALAEESLVVGYQPIVDLGSGRLLGLEALLRWSHPELGPVTPEEVVAAATTTGLSFELDQAVTQLSARELDRLRHSGAVDDDVFVAVNISSRTAQQQRLDGLVQQVLDETRLPACCLTLEITEHALMDNADHAVALLTRLVKSGVRVAIDDFGTGYNSLVHLQRLPVRTLKIDRSFVSDLVDGAESLVIARSIVGLAAALGMEVVAEGVESESQVRLLRDLGCQAAQGFLWSPAVPVDALPAALAGLQPGRAVGRSTGERTGR